MPRVSWSSRYKIQDIGTNLDVDIEQELRNLSPRRQRRVVDRIANYRTIQDELVEDWEEIGGMYADLCRMWDSTPEEQQQEDRNTIEKLWLTMETKFENLIDGLRSAFNLNFARELDFFSRVLKEHLDACQNDLDGLRTNFNNKVYAQTKGDKVRGRPPYEIDGPDSTLYKLCQTQVLPPRSKVRSGSTTEPKNDPLILASIVGATREWRWTDAGSGGQGQVALYESVDRSGAVKDRLVIKNTLGLYTEDQFRHPIFWHGDTSDAKFGEECVPMEYHTQKLVSQARALDSHNTVKLLAPPQVRWDRQEYRLYMEHVPDGDLDDLIKKHVTHNEPIPETFLWMVFHALLNNALIMQQGELDNALDPWSQIVHCDLKAANIIMGLPNTEFFPQYPTPKYVHLCPLARIVLADYILGSLTLVWQFTPTKRIELIQSCILDQAHTMPQNKYPGLIASQNSRTRYVVSERLF